MKKFLIPATALFALVIAVFFAVFSDGQHIGDAENSYTFPMKSELGYIGSYSCDMSFVVDELGYFFGDTPVTWWYSVTNEQQYQAYRSSFAADFPDHDFEQSYLVIAAGRELRTLVFSKQKMNAAVNGETYGYWTVGNVVFEKEYHENTVFLYETEKIAATDQFTLGVNPVSHILIGD